MQNRNCMRNVCIKDIRKCFIMPPKKKNSPMRNYCCKMYIRIVNWLNIYSKLRIGNKLWKNRKSSKTIYALHVHYNVVVLNFKSKNTPKNQWCLFRRQRVSSFVVISISSGIVGIFILRLFSITCPRLLDYLFLINKWQC